MMRLLKIGGAVLASIVGLVLCAALTLYLVGQHRAGGGDAIAVHEVAVASDSASVARGAHVARAIAACTNCHGDRVEGKMFGTPALFVRMAAPNLTQGGVGASYNTTDWDRAIRHGVARDGRRLIIMPSESYRSLSDSDFAAVVAWLRSIPSVTDSLPARRIGPVGGILIGAGALHDSVGRAHPVPGATAAYGEYLSAVGSCASCHGPDLNGRKGGGGGPAGPSLLALVSSWSAADFTAALRTGRDRTGRVLSEEMPWRNYGQMSDAELAAIWEYVKQQQQQPTRSSGS